MSFVKLNGTNARYCFLDIDIDNCRQKIANAASFCANCNNKYGLSSNDLRQLGGSELNRLPDLIKSDHDYQDRPFTVRAQLSRIIFELDWENAPITCENFATLCTNTKVVGDCGKVLSYRGSKIHRVVPGFIVQGGDFVFGNGSGGESIYNGKKFKDEKAGLAKQHNTRGILSMGNSGKNSNTSQFFITFKETPQCDGKHVIFGRVISGWKVLDLLEKVVERNHDDSSPLPVEVIVTDCGTWDPCDGIPASGYWFDKPDPETYSGISPVFVGRPRVGLLVPNAAVRDRFLGALDDCEVIVSINDAQLLKKRFEEHCIDVILVAHSLAGSTDVSVLMDEVRVVISKPADARKVLSLQ